MRPLSGVGASGSGLFFNLIYFTMKKEKFKKQLLRFGKWVHKAAPNGVLDVDKRFVEKLVENFRKSPFAPITRGHVKDKDKNPQLIVNKSVSDLEVREDGLYGEFELPKKELDKYNDVSLEIDMTAEDHETGKLLGPVLRGIALVTDPYIKGLKPFMQLEDSNSNLLINLSEISMIDHKQVKAEVEEKAAVEEISEDKKPKEKVVKSDEIKETETDEPTEAEEKEESKAEEKSEANDKPTDKEEKETGEESVVEEKKAEVVEASEKTPEERIADLEELVAKQAVELSEKKAISFYDKFLRDGKVVPAQKSAFINLCTSPNSVIELSDGTTKNIIDLVVELFDNGPQVINLKEKGVDVEAESTEAKKENQYKTQMRTLPRYAKLSEEEFDEFYANNKATIEQVLASKTTDNDKK